MIYSVCLKSEHLLSESNNSTGIISFTEEGFSFSRHGFDAYFFSEDTQTDRSSPQRTDASNDLMLFTADDFRSEASRVSIKI